VLILCTVWHLKWVIFMNTTMTVKKLIYQDLNINSTLPKKKRQPPIIATPQLLGNVEKCTHVSVQISICRWNVLCILHKQISYILLSCSCLMCRLVLRCCDMLQQKTRFCPIKQFLGKNAWTKSAITPLKITIFERFKYR